MRRQLTRCGGSNGTYFHGSRYPFNELLEHNDAYNKWLICFHWSIGMVTGLMPMDVQPSHAEDCMPACILRCAQVD